MRGSEYFARFRGPLLAGLAIVLLWFAAGASRGFLDVVARANPGAVLLMLIATAFWLVVRFVRWQYLMRHAGIRVAVRGSAAAYLAALPGTATPAYVGELVRCVFIRRRFGIPGRLTAWVIVSERLMDVVALALLFAVTSTGWWRVAGAVAFTVLVLVLYVTRTQRAGRESITDEPRERISIGSMAVALLLSLVLWAAAGMLISLGASAVGGAVAPVESIRAFSLASLGGALSLMPAGIGTTGSIMILEVSRMGEPLENAVAIVSLVRLTSTGAVIALGCFFLWRELRSENRSASSASAHFNSIADDYLAQFPDHVWEHLIGRKLQLITDAVVPLNGGQALLLDVGCGLGIQSAELRRAGNNVVGIDVSEGLLRHAASKGVPVTVSSAGRLPFPSDSFDAAYAIGVLHHLESRAAQREAFDEVLRVLKPGGSFLIHESNPRNPLFRFYFGYAFPILRSIDEGTERWIDPRSLAELTGFAHERTTYFTFLPDFVPRAMMPPLLAVQRRLERSPVREWAVHYFAVLRKPSSLHAGTAHPSAPSGAHSPASIS